MHCTIMFVVTLIVLVFLVSSSAFAKPSRPSFAVCRRSSSFGDYAAKANEMIPGLNETQSSTLAFELLKKDKDNEKELLNTTLTLKFEKELSELNITLSQVSECKQAYLLDLVSAVTQRYLLLRMLL